MTFGEQIKKAREERRLTQEQLAEAMEVTRQAVSKWEANQSRPAAAKLARLSELLDLPQEALDPPLSPEAEALRKWKTAALGLGTLCLVLGALCLVLSAALFHGRTSAVPDEGTELVSEGHPNPAGPDALSDTYTFPRSIPLAMEPVEDLGCQAMVLSERVPKDGDVLFSGQFSGPYSDGSRLEIRRSNPWEENRTTFWEVWAFWVKADGEEAVLGRLSDYNHYVNQDGLEVAYFGNVLGYNGYKVTLIEGAACVTNWYFILAENGPRLLLQASGSNTPVECDVDGDGEDEVITTYGNPWGCCIYDTTRISGEGRRYELTWETCKQVPITFTETGFCILGGDGQVLARYTLAETGSLLLEAPEE